MLLGMLTANQNQHLQHYAPLFIKSLAASDVVAFKKLANEFYQKSQIPVSVLVLLMEKLELFSPIMQLYTDAKAISTFFEQMFSTKLGPHALNLLMTSLYATNPAVTEQIFRFYKASETIAVQTKQVDFLGRNLVWHAFASKTWETNLDHVQALLGEEEFTRQIHQKDLYQNSLLTMLASADNVVAVDLLITRYQFSIEELLKAYDATKNEMIKRDLKKVIALSALAKGEESQLEALEGRLEGPIPKDYFEFYQQFHDAIPYLYLKIHDGKNALEHAVSKGNIKDIMDLLRKVRVMPNLHEAAGSPEALQALFKNLKVYGFAIQDLIKPEHMSYFADNFQLFQHFYAEKNSAANIPAEIFDDVTGYVVNTINKFLEPNGEIDLAAVINDIDANSPNADRVLAFLSKSDMFHRFMTKNDTYLRRWLARNDRGFAIEALLSKDSPMRRNIDVSILDVTTQFNRGYVADHLRLHGMLLSDVLTPEFRGSYQAMELFFGYPVVRQRFINEPRLLNNDAIYLTQYFDNKQPFSPVTLSVLESVAENKAVARAVAQQDQAERARYQEYVGSERNQAESLACFRLAQAHYGAEFAQRGLVNIEASIRGLILDTIRGETFNIELQQFIVRNRAALIQGNNPVLMEQARAYMNSSTNENHIAWRAYDQWAPIAGGFPNQLTRGNTAVEPNHVRNIVAHFYLGLMDEALRQEQTPEEFERRKITFIGTIYEIRAGHGSRDGVDIPSCEGGSIGRTSKMTTGNKYLENDKPIAQIPESMQNVMMARLQARYAGASDEVKEEVAFALTFLDKINHSDLCSGKLRSFMGVYGQYTAESVNNRYEEIMQLMQRGSLLHALNQDIIQRKPNLAPAPGNEGPLRVADLCYVTRQLKDITLNSVGPRVADAIRPRPPVVDEGKKMDIVNPDAPYAAIIENQERQLNLAKQPIQKIRIERILNDAKMKNAFYQIIYPSIVSMPDLNALPQDVLPFIVKKYVEQAFKEDDFNKENLYLNAIKLDVMQSAYAEYRETRQFAPQACFENAARLQQMIEEINIVKNGARRAGPSNALSSNTRKSSQNNIAFEVTPEEWAIAHAHFAASRQSGKINKRVNPKLQHSFVCFDSGEIIAMPNKDLNAWMPQYNGAFGKVKCGINERNQTRGLKIETAIDIQGEAPLLPSRRHITERIGFTQGEFLRQYVSEKSATPFIKRYMAMEWFEGVDLHHFLGQNPDLSEEIRLEIAYQLCQRINTLHGQGIIHADIKPANFMRTVNKESNEFMIVTVDYGISLEIPKGVPFIQDAHKAGTEGYRAPEIHFDDPAKYGQFSFASDVYALGKLFVNDLKLTGIGFEAMYDDNVKNRPKLAKVQEQLAQRLEALNASKPGPSVGRAVAGSSGLTIEQLARCQVIGRGHVVRAR